MELSLKIPASEEEIRTETTRLRSEIAKRRGEIDMLAQAVKHYQRQCSHPGQKTGWNERDGNWACPCDVCGYSY